MSDAAPAATAPAPAAVSEADQLLKRADSLRTSNHAEFTATLQRLDQQASRLSPQQQQYLRYLKGYRSAYEGRYAEAIPLLTTFINETSDVTLRFRASATVVNVLTLSRQYEMAFVHLKRLLDLLPTVTDPEAREQGLGMASYLYNQVGQYDLGLQYADKVVVENGTDRSECTGAQLQLESLYKSGNLRVVDGKFQRAVDACVRLAELTYANVIRTYIARLYLDQYKYDEAIALLRKYYGEVVQARYPRLVAEYEALLAQGYRLKGDTAQARKFAASSIESGVKGQFTEPLVSAYRLLYEVALEQGEYKAALGFHERYAVADKGYLDDVSARQLAFQKVQHEAIATKLQIDALNRQNQVLQLQQALDARSVENSRLSIALLLLLLVFIAFWAYKTKRSQLHFMKRSQQDGLTGIANRPHFIEQAERALHVSSKLQQEACVILCDLDRFKAINDMYGHATGDFVLKQAVQACQSHMRATDLFGRVGGEEFGILISNCTPEQARQRSEQMREAIANMVMSRGGTESGVTASFGVSGTQLSGHELWQLMAHADSALYRAKRDGRNRVVVFDASVTSPIDIGKARKRAASAEP